MEQYNTLHINNLEFTLLDNPFYLEALEDNSTVRIVHVGQGVAQSSYSISKTNFINSYSTYDFGSVITLNRGERVYWYSEDEFQNGSDRYDQFQMTGKIKAGGNIQSLMNYCTSLHAYCFNYLFFECSSLVDASELSLPATELGFYCYRGMFNACTSLTTPPAILPATTLLEGCYYGMFIGCSSLTSVPVLPATTLALYCYAYMFMSCTSLATVPSNMLPATRLEDYCYYRMFSQNPSLTTAPELPATSFKPYWWGGDAYRCYTEMFMHCTSLNYIKCMIEEPNSDNSWYWVYNVSPTGTFVKSPNATWDTGNSGIPTGWTVVDAS